MLKKIIIPLILSISVLCVGCVSRSKETVVATQNEKVVEKEQESVEQKEETAEKKEETAQKKEDMRIISGTVAVTEVMDRLNIDLVGVPKTSKVLPEKYSGVQDVGQSFEPNFEVIASLSPDLLIFDENFKDKIEPQVNQYGMNVYYFNTSTFENFKQSIEELGEILNKKEEANELTKELQESVDKVVEKGGNKKEDINVAILFGTSESYMLATDDSYVGDLLNTIGVSNVTDELDQIDSAYVNYSTEQILQLNPDYVLRLSHGDLEENKKNFENEFEKNPVWKSLDATKEGRVYDLDPSLFAVSANLSISNAIQELGNILYGE